MQNKAVCKGFLTVLIICFLSERIFTASNKVKCAYLELPHSVITAFPTAKQQESNESIGLALAGETTCPDGWLGFQGSCYLFGTNGVHFTEAEHFCRQHGDSHLIHLDDKAKNEFIKSKLRELNRNIWWIGMTDELVEGIWKWTDTDRTLSFTDFEPSEGTTDAEDCGVFWPPFNFRWADISCTSDNYVS